MYRRSLFFLGGASAVLAQQQSSRLARAERIRNQSISRMLALPEAVQTPNGDEQRYASFAGSYSKGLPHDPRGLPGTSAYHIYSEALRSGSVETMERIPMGGAARFACPMGAQSFDFTGLDSCQYVLPPAPELASAEHAADMAEVHWRALARDVPFEEFGTHAVTCSAASRLKQYAGYKGPDPGQHLFRGTAEGDLAGPYVSQFLWHPVPFGSTEIPQRWRTFRAGKDYLQTRAEWLETARGGTRVEPVEWAPEPRFIVTPRDLAAYVWKDFSFQAFLNAGLILLGWGGAVAHPGNPYARTAAQAGFVNFGGPMVLDFVARAANAALRAAWFQKWQVHRRLRPEETAGRREALTGLVHPDMNADGFELLPMAYPEGCPLHPAYPAGHATIAGACTAVLKALFDVTAPVPQPVTPERTGQRLEPWKGETLTIGGELDKLASNIAYGRDFAGVHYRSDGYWGLRLGEAVAHSMLADLFTGLPEEFLRG